MLKENEIKGSMSRPGCSYDNSCIESFFDTEKSKSLPSELWYNGSNKTRYVSIHRIILQQKTSSFSFRLHESG